jgi:hypothetical protein
MRPASRSHAVLVALLAAASAAAWAADDAKPAASPLLYGLTGDPAAERSLLAARWAPPSASLRLDAAAGLGAHEVRVLGSGTTLRAGSSPSAAYGDETPVDWTVDPVRATYRYTLLAAPKWAMKLGMSANLGEPAGTPRPPQFGADRAGFGSLPLVHLAGVGQWSPRWRLAFALDGLATGRGRALDLGMQVDYVWSPSMSVFGGYQVTEAAGEAEDFYGAGLSNRANVGLRYRF